MAKDFFSKNQQDQIVESIKIAERNTSGEIQLHVEEYCKLDPIERAIEVFSHLEIHKTELKNGVLFYLAVKDKKFAIIGDEGINKLVPDDFWETIKSEMKSNFKAGRFCEGICEGILKAGEQLKMHFPYQANDSNELSDEISFGQ
ncbi:MAG: TPM domain-containing protein [Cytophagales bacterium]|nr:MAG: TPM domain-containing protein [Cytophagales bacterium]